MPHTTLSGHLYVRRSGHARAVTRVGPGARGPGGAWARGRVGSGARGSGGAWARGAWARGARTRGARARSAWTRARWPGRAGSGARVLTMSNTNHVTVSKRKYFVGYTHEHNVEKGYAEQMLLYFLGI